MAIGVRHDDWQTRRASLSWSNQEIGGYTDLVQETRAQVRHEMATNLARLGGVGLVARSMRLRVDEQECANNDPGGDHVDEASLQGTALLPLRRGVAGEAAAPLRILRLGQTHADVLVSTSGSAALDGRTRRENRRT